MERIAIKKRSIMNRTYKVPRKAAKHTLPYHMTGEQRDVVSLPNDEAMPARKKYRLEEIILPTTTYQAGTKAASADVKMSLPSPAADVDDDNAKPDSVTDTESNPKATGATGRWTREEDAKLTSAVAKICKTKCGKELSKDWVAISALVPSRTKKQCILRWQNAFDHEIGGASRRRTGKWTNDEVSKLKDAVQTLGGKDWGTIASLVPGRTIKQCSSRWYSDMNPNRLIPTAERNIKWSPDEDNKLKDAVQMQHGVKDWDAIAALVPDRRKKQCQSRWETIATNHSIDPETARNGRFDTWTKDEDDKLKDSVQMHGGKDWAAIASQVPGRTKKQCTSRWHDFLKKGDHGTGRLGLWTIEEDNKLRHAVELNGGKDWDAIAALVAGRTLLQCKSRWHAILKVTERPDIWTTDEDNKLKDAVQMHGDENWGVIAALVPGREEEQCCRRWNDALDPNIDRVGKWTEDEDVILKESVEMHGGKDWAGIAALVPGRVAKQCWTRWNDALDPDKDREIGRTAFWTKDEDEKLKDSVHQHGTCKDWGSIAKLVPGRTRNQCKTRWHKAFKNPRNDRASGRKGKRAKNEDSTRHRSTVASMARIETQLPHFSGRTKTGERSAILEEDHETLKKEPAPHTPVTEWIR
jgi:hypothetical protein